MGNYQVPDAVFLQSRMEWMELALSDWEDEVYEY
jgi:hypothetical protein